MVWAEVNKNLHPFNSFIFITVTRQLDNNDGSDRERTRDEHKNQVNVFLAWFLFIIRNYRLSSVRESWQKGTDFSFIDCLCTVNDIKMFSLLSLLYFSLGSEQWVLTITTLPLTAGSCWPLTKNDLFLAQTELSPWVVNTKHFAVDSKDDQCYAASYDIANFRKMANISHLNQMAV